MRKYSFKSLVSLTAVFVLTFSAQITRADTAFPTATNVRQDLLSQQIAAGNPQAIQKFLNASGSPVALSGPGSAGNETKTLGAATKRALCKYQVNVLGLLATSDYCGWPGPWTLKRIQEQLEKSASTSTDSPTQNIAGNSGASTNSTSSTDNNSSNDAARQAKINAILEQLKLIQAQVADQSTSKDAVLPAAPPSDTTKPKDTTKPVSAPNPIFDPLAPDFGDISLPLPQQFVSIGTPEIKSLSLNSAIVGGSSFVLTITGTGFGSNGINFNSIVSVNGQDRPTTYVLPTQVRAIISATDIATVGTLNIVVYNPTGDPQMPLVSNALTFTVAPKPAPANGSTTSSTPSATTSKSKDIYRSMASILDAFNNLLAQIK